MSSWGQLGAAMMFASVAAGAFGAHGLKSRLTPELLTVWETAARYMAYHGLGLLYVAWLSERHPVDLVGRFFCLGILLFCGSLFLLALTGHKWLGLITPLGGLFFLGGWGVLASRKW